MYFDTTQLFPDRLKDRRCWFRPLALASPTMQKTIPSRRTVEELLARSLRAGDVDGDGYDDLIVGAWQYASVAISAGRSYLYSGKDGHLLKTFTCRTPGDTFGFDATGIGDVDGDGIIDLLITSAWSG